MTEHGSGHAMASTPRLRSSWILRALREAGWAPLVVFLLHVLASRFGLYTRVPALDIPMHLAGGVVMCFFLSRCSQAAADSRLLGSPAAPVRVILLFASTCTIAVFWELTEFTCDAVFQTQAQLGLEDTLGDVMFGMGGCVLFLVASRALASARGSSRVAVESGTEEFRQLGGGTVETRWPEP